MNWFSIAIICIAYTSSISLYWRMEDSFDISYLTDLNTILTGNNQCCPRIITPIRQTLALCQFIGWSPLITSIGMQSTLEYRGGWSGDLKQASVENGQFGNVHLCYGYYLRCSSSEMNYNITLVNRSLFNLTSSISSGVAFSQ